MEIITTSPDGLYVIRKLQNTLADYQQISAWLSDDRVLAFYEGRDHPISAAEAEEHFSPAACQAEKLQPCILLYDNKPVGFMQFYPADITEYHFSEPGLTYGLDQYIGQPDLWGKGHGTRFVSLILDFLFQNSSADWVILDPHIDNERAIRCYTKCGFKKIKVLTAHEWHEGQQVDCWLMAISKVDYQFKLSG